MAKRQRRGKRPFRKRAAKRGGDPFARRPTSVCARRDEATGNWELVHPPCAVEREVDLEDVHAMLEAGEVDVAIEELRWLLSGCADFIAAHRLLGELALETSDLSLARGHFGYAFDIGRSALPGPEVNERFLYSSPANQALFEAAKGLAHCLRELGKPDLAVAVVREMLAWDASDPLGVRAWLDQPQRTDDACGE